MNLLKETKTLLIKYHLSPDLLLHQNFCVDGAVLDVVVDAGALTKEDIVLEIGAGTGLLTKKLAEKVKKVIAIEKDERLKPALQENLRGGFPNKKIEIIFADALEILSKRKDYNKIIANIPYQLAEPLLSLLCTAPEVERSIERSIERTILMVPKKFAVHVQEHPYFSAFFQFQWVQEVPREAFYPPPKVISAILVVTKKKNVGKKDFLLQQLYLQREKKLKNALREACIALAVREGKELTKKEAKKMIGVLKLSQKELEMSVARAPLFVIKAVEEKLDVEGKLEVKKKFKL